MNKSLKLLNDHVNERGIYVSPEDGWNEFYRVFSSEFKKFLKQKECKLVKITKNYFYLSGFFRMSNGGYAYFNIEDWRWHTTFMMRTAKNERDYTGGTNNFFLYDDVHKFEYDFNRFLKKYNK